MTHSPSVSIIIPTYNRCELVDYTLLSISKSSIDLNTIEVIISDDGSSDDTKSLADKYGTYFKVKYLYQEDDGRRVSLARNRGIENAEGDICIFVDAGILVSSDFIKEHIRCHVSASASVTVIGYVYGFENHNDFGDELEKLIDPNNPDQSIAYFNRNQVFLDVREPHYQLYKDDLTSLPAPWVFYWSCNISVKRTDLIRLGLFDVNYDQNWGMEDLDLGYRLHKAGVKTVLSRSAGAIHFPHEKDETTNFKQQETNKKYFLKKFPTPETELFYDLEIRLNESLLKMQKELLDTNVAQL